jgi:hypothetical protein
LTSAKEQNSELESEISQKRKRNEQVTREISSLPAKSERKSIADDLEPNTQLLETLTGLYINNFKQPQEAMSLEEVMSDYSLEITDSPILTEWSMMLQNGRLKRQIASYEQLEQPESKARKILMG